MRARRRAGAWSATRAARTAPTRSTGCRSRAGPPTTAAVSSRRSPSSSSMKARIFRPPGCSTKQASCSRAEAPPLRQRPHQPRDLALDQGRHVLGEHRMKSVILQIEAERVGRVGKEVRQRLQDRARRRPPPGRASARSPPSSSAAAAPSPKSAVDTRFASDTSARWMLRLGSSTATTSARASGKPTRKSCARASAAAPPEQPSAVIGSRRTSSESRARCRGARRARGS